MESPLCSPHVCSRKNRFHLYSCSFCILTSSVQWGFNDITQQMNLPLRKSWDNYFASQVATVDSSLSESSSTIHSWNPTAAVCLSTPDSCCPLHKTEMQKKKKSSQLNWCLLGLTTLRVLLDRPASLWYYLNHGIFPHSFSNTNEAKVTANSISEARVLTTKSESSEQRSWKGFKSKSTREGAKSHAFNLKTKACL